MEKNSERNPLSKQKQEKKGMKNRYADRNQLDRNINHSDFMDENNKNNEIEESDVVILDENDVNL